MAYTEEVNITKLKITNTLTGGVEMQLSQY